MFKPPLLHPEHCEHTFVHVKSIQDDTKDVYIARVCKVSVPKFAVLYGHGNSEDVSMMMRLIEFISKTYDATVYAFEYAGYGPTQDDTKPSMSNCIDDAMTAFEYMKSIETTLPKVLWARSMGCSPIIKVAMVYEQDVQAIILESPFISPLSIYLPFHFFGVENDFDSYYDIKKVNAPILFIHGDHDQVIRCSHSKDLFKLCPSIDKEIHLIEGASHNDLYSKQFQMIVHAHTSLFLNKHCKL